MVSPSLGKPASPLPPDTGKGTGTERENDGLPWPLTPDANNLKNVSVEFLGEQKKSRGGKHGQTPSLTARGSRSPGVLQRACGCDKRLPGWF